MARRWSDLTIVFTGAAGLAVIGVLTSGAKQGATGTELLKWLLVGIGAVGAAAAAAFVLRHPTERLLAAARHRTAVVIGFSACVGAVFGFADVVGQRLLGLASPETPVEIIVIAALYTPLYALGIWLIRESFDVHSRLRREVMDDLVAIEATRLQESLFIGELRAHITSDITTSLAATKQLIDEQLQQIHAERGTTPWSAMAEALRSAAQVQVRGASRRLWENVEATYPRPSAFTLLSDVIRRQPLRPGMVIAAYAIASTSELVRLHGLAAGLTEVVVVSAGIWFVMSVANLFMRAMPAAHALIYTLAVTSFQMLNLYAAVMDARADNVPVNVALVVLQTVSSVCVIVGASGVYSLRQAQGERAARIRADIDHEQIAQIARGRAIAGVARESARMLHGQVQTRLVGCAIAIDLAADTGDTAAVERALASARTVLTDPMPLQEHPERSLWNQLEDVVDLWEGLCSVDAFLAEGLEQVSPDTAARIGRIVEEAVTNAVRHGGATAVEVRVERVVAPRIRVAVSDNGSGPAHGAAGLGSALLSDAARGMWHLEQRTESPGACLIAYVEESVDA